MIEQNFYAKYFKRFLDILFSFLGLIILSPIFLLIAIIVKIKLGNPIFFVQIRPGKNEKLFRMYKFRTMIDRNDCYGNPVNDELRLTKFGKLLRSTSLDELPELWNILKGDMSLIGPRPLLVEYLDLYDKNQRKRHLVRPGLTGLAQISGRNTLSWDERFELDLSYVSNISFLLDLKIFFVTFFKVLKRDGISQNSNIPTVEKFMGNKIKEEDK
ncbi:sugar transferase [Enterococcus casseliflavus]|nr:sugar transferase [Enterococcus casseliflavus]